MREPSAVDATAFSFHDAELMQDPVPFYDEMRRKCPVAHSDQHGGFYFVTNFVGAKRVYDEYLSFSSKDGTALPKQPLPLYPADLDPPEQLRLRRLLNPFFVVEAAATHAADVKEVVERLIDAFIDKGEAELQRDLIHPTLSGIVLPFMGAPMSDLPMLSSKIHHLTRHRADDPDGCARIGEELGAYLLEITDRRRREEPKQDILQTLVDAKIEGKPLSDMEILDTLTLILFGGLDTTSAALTEGFLHLSRNPSDADRLRSGEVPWRSAIEEFVRFASPVQGLRRTVAKEVELEGRVLSPGDFVFAMNGAANRDPDRFSEPNRIIIDRQMDGHLGFGAGAHICLGQHFARTLMEVVLKTTLTRIPDLSTPGDFAPEYAVGESRVMKTLPIRFKARSSSAAA